MSAALGCSPTMPTVAEVEALREELWDAGFSPIAVCNHNSPRHEEKLRGKAPVEPGWQRGGPPGVVTSNALNTGILCDRLRPIDIDVDNPTIAASVKACALDMFGEAPIRYRGNSPRVTLLYRAAAGEPRKRHIAGPLGKVEVLGKGQQFVAFGVHHTGAMLRWMPEAPGGIAASALPAITEEQVTAFLAACAPSIGAKQPTGANGSDDHRTSPLGQQGDLLEVLAAVRDVPNDDAPDWES